MARGSKIHQISWGSVVGGASVARPVAVPVVANPVRPGAFSRPCLTDVGLGACRVGIGAVERAVREPVGLGLAPRVARVRPSGPRRETGDVPSRPLDGSGHPWPGIR